MDFNDSEDKSELSAMERLREPDGIYDPEVVVHPGFVGQKIKGEISWPAERVEEAREKRKFSDFERFINLEGIDPKIAQQLNTVLSNLFDKTGSYWEPKLCQECCLRMFNSITSNDVPLPENIKAAWVFKMNHSWLELIIEGIEEPVIYDPTGLDPRDGYMNANMYEPYFGLRSNAPDYLIGEYTHTYKIERIFSDRPSIAIKWNTVWGTNQKTVTEIPRASSTAKHWDLIISKNP